MIYIQIADSSGLPVEESTTYEQLLELSALETLKDQPAWSLQPLPENYELTIVLTDDAQLQELNRSFLDIDAPTDVLAFPADEADPDSQALYLGDVLISFPRAQAQASAGGHPVTQELQLLVVHGVLHLLGHDHAEPQEKAAMWAAQAKILTRLGCPQVAPGE